MTKVAKRKKGKSFRYKRSDGYKMIDRLARMLTAIKYMYIGTIIMIPQNKHIITQKFVKKETPIWWGFQDHLTKA